MKGLELKGEKHLGNLEKGRSTDRQDHPFEAPSRRLKKKNWLEWKYFG